MVGTVNAVRSDFGHRGVSSSCLLDYGKITGCNEIMFNYTRLSDPLMISPWEGLSVRSFLAQYMNVLHDSVPGVVYPRADEYTSKFVQ